MIGRQRGEDGDFDGIGRRGRRVAVTAKHEEN